MNKLPRLRPRQRSGNRLEKPVEGANPRGVMDNFNGLAARGRWTHLGVLSGRRTAIGGTYRQNLLE